MKRIDLRGVIVGSAHDADWAKTYIEKGRFTPDSYFRRELAAADGDDVEVYICSQGGDVTAGYEIANAIKAYKGNVTLIVGAFAASMAANIALTSGRPVKAFSNSILLFHGAWSLVMGGSGAMEDEARVLDQINQPIKDALVAHGVPQEKVDEGFAEGRMYTMGAEEALSLGIVSEIIDGSAEQPEPISGEDADAIAAASEGGLPVAALCSVPEAAEMPRVAPVAGDGGNAANDSQGCGEAVLARLEAAESRVRELEAERDALAGAHRRELDAAKAESDVLRRDLEASRKAHSALVGRVMGSPSCDRAAMDFKEAVKEFGYAGARRRYPQLCAEYRRG